MLSESTPTYVYKLIPSSAPPPDPIPETLPLSPLDTASGFIHLSTALQIPSTLKLFFAKERRVYVLRLNYDQLDKDVRWEDPKAEVLGPRGGEGMFPHLYNGGQLGDREIESVAVWERDEVGWDLALKKAEMWLLY